MRGAEWEPMWIFLRSVPQMPQVATLIRQLSRADVGHGDGFNAHVVDAAIDHGAHGGGELLFRSDVSVFEIWVAIPLSDVTSFIEKIEQAFRMLWEAFLLFSPIRMSAGQCQGRRVEKATMPVMEIDRRAG